MTHSRLTKSVQLVCFHWINLFQSHPVREIQFYFATDYLEFSYIATKSNTPAHSPHLRSSCGTWGFHPHGQQVYCLIRPRLKYIVQVLIQIGSTSWYWKAMVSASVNVGLWTWPSISFHKRTYARVILIQHTHIISLPQVSECCISRIYNSLCTWH